MICPSLNSLLMNITVANIGNSREKNTSRGMKSTFSKISNTVLSGRFITELS